MKKGFKENSRIGKWCRKNVPILPAISEYNSGGGTDVSGTSAQTEALGCYADQGIYSAILWGGDSYIYSGIKLYTNYDVNNST